MNVLIALGALRKEGGRIVSDRMHRKEWRGKHKSSEEIESLNKKLALKEYVIY